ncbi:hypothetical protein MP228_001918 [Amoeboaphelidium protococcarum]|nr:hypothetical protein MP228_001918 [Amoeboaphelidium protococcarum]
MRNQNFLVLVLSILLNIISVKCFRFIEEGILAGWELNVSSMYEYGLQNCMELQVKLGVPVFNKGEGHNNDNPQKRKTRIIKTLATLKYDGGVQVQVQLRFINAALYAKVPMHLLAYCKVRDQTSDHVKWVLLAQSEVFKVIKLSSDGLRTLNDKREQLNVQSLIKDVTPVEYYAQILQSRSSDIDYRTEQCFKRKVSRNQLVEEMQKLKGQFLCSRIVCPPLLQPLIEEAVRQADVRIQQQLERRQEERAPSVLLQTKRLYHKTEVTSTRFARRDFTTQVQFPDEQPLQSVVQLYERLQLQWHQQDQELSLAPGVRLNPIRRARLTMQSALSQLPQLASFVVRQVVRITRIKLLGPDAQDLTLDQIMAPLFTSLNIRPLMVTCTDIQQFDLHSNNRSVLDYFKNTIILRAFFILIHALLDSSQN